MKLEKNIEELLKDEVKKWGDEAPSRSISLEELRSKAQALNTTEREAIEQEVAELFPVQVITPEQKNKRPWRRYVAGLVAACMLFVLAPTIARSAVDLPGLGVYIQQFAMRHVGLEWAFENGYMQGTVAQISKNGVTLKILGIVADPVETTVIYLLQGVPGATTETPGAVVYINSVDGEGVMAWTNQHLAATSVGLVGTTHTRALPNTTGIINVEVKLPHGDTMAISIPVSREEISKLAQDIELNFEQTIEGITVRATKAVLTPTQLMVDYSITGGHDVWGVPPQDYLSYLSADDERYRKSDGSGGHLDYETDTWHLKSVFSRPKDLSEVKLVIPALSRSVPAELEWHLDGDRATAATDSGVELQIFDIRKAVSSVYFRYYPTETIWAPLEYTVTHADGSISVAKYPRQSWRPGDSVNPHWTGVEIELDSSSMPVVIRASAMSFVINGPWEIPINLR